MFGRLVAAAVSARATAVAVAATAVALATLPLLADSSAQASVVTFATASEETAPPFGAAPEAMCSGRRHVLGGGVLSTAGFDGTDVLGLRPSAAPDAPYYDAWRAVATASEAATVTTYAACRAQAVYHQHKAFAIGVGERKTRVVHCPRGFRVTGGGVTSPETTEVKSTRPTDDGKAWEGSLFNSGDIGTDWGMHVFCADGNFAKHLVYKHSTDQAATGEQEGLITDCPGRDGLVGGGVYIGPGDSNLNTTAPLGDHAWRSYVDHVSIGPPLQFKNYAICFHQRASNR
jgi:hypothetical protein